MDDHGDAIARQSGKPFEEQERKQLRYMLERFWNSSSNRKRLQRMGAWLTAAFSLAVAFNQLLPAILAWLRGHP